MRILVLGGTSFLSRETARVAVRAGHDVVCLARGTGDAPEGSELVAGDRDDPGVYGRLHGEWDAVVDVTSNPTHARGALGALASTARQWTYVSSCSVYADQGTPQQDESAPVLDAYDGEGPVPLESYGEAKVACEQACTSALKERALVVRPGLICGPGDPSDRFGYWPARLAQGGDVVVPDIPDASTQTIDVRDLARWILDSAVAGLTGTYNAVGPSLPFGELLARTAEITNFEGELRWLPPSLLIDQGIAFWAGADSLPHWLPDGFEGFAARSGEAARNHGLTHTSVRDTIARVLEDERVRGIGRPRRAGLTPESERKLLSVPVPGRL